MLQNAYFLAKIGADTAENEQHFAEILPKTGNYPAQAVPCVRPALPPAVYMPRAEPERARAGRKGAASTLVERCEIEAYADFSAK